MGTSRANVAEVSCAAFMAVILDVSCDKVVVARMSDNVVVGTEEVDVVVETVVERFFVMTSGMTAVLPMMSPPLSSTNVAPATTIVFATSAGRF